LTPERIASLRRPVLCVFGEQSNCLPSCRGLQRQLPGCRVAIVPRVGHFHPISRPAVFAQHLRAFLAEVA
jgi:pimeloyl-ACP methyl ester carboxylesterase